MAVLVSAKDGKVTMEVDGVRGPGCKGILEAVVAAAGGKIVKEDPKDDYYAQVSSDATQSEGT